MTPSITEFHEPCENLQILIPEDKTSLLEPKVRYHSGSETVEIECSEIKGNVHTEDVNQLKETYEDLEIKHSNDGRLLSNEDEMSNSQLGIYDDDDVKVDVKDEKDNETNLEQVVNTVLENEVDPILDNCKHTDTTDEAHMNTGAAIRENPESRDDKINTGHKSDNESMEEFIDKNDDRADDARTQEQRKSDESDEYGNGVEESDVTTEEDDEKGNSCDENDKKNDSDNDYSNQEKDENTDEFHDTEGDDDMEANGLPIKNCNNSGQVSKHHEGERKLETSDNQDSLPIDDSDNEYHEEERQLETSDNHDSLPIDDSDNEYHEEERQLRTDDNRDALPIDDNNSGQISEHHEEERMLKTDDNRDSCKIS